MGYKKILVVDDDEKFVEIVLRLLKMKGYTGDGVTNVKEAINKIQKEKYSLILLDLMIPGVGGFDAIKMIKNVPGYEDVPIIIITAKDDPDLERKGIKAGAEDFIFKPFDVENFFDKIHRNLKRKNSYRNSGIV